MTQRLSVDTFLPLLTMVALAGGLTYRIITARHRAKATAAQEADLAARFGQLRLRLWEAPGICAGVDAEMGALIARAERAWRVAQVSEQHALAALKQLGTGPDPQEAAVLPVADQAVQAEERMRRLLRALTLLLPDVAAAELGAAQEAFLRYRDHHVRMCRELRGNDDDRMLVRHLVSETVTLARIADLEDLAAAAGIVI